MILRLYVEHRFTTTHRRTVCRMLRVCIYRLLYIDGTPLIRWSRSGLEAVLLCTGPVLHLWLCCGDRETADGRHHAARLTSFTGQWSLSVKWPPARNLSKCFQLPLVWPNLAPPAAERYIGMRIFVMAIRMSRRSTVQSSILLGREKVDEWLIQEKIQKTEEHSDGVFQQ